jgi:hypothetical protein
VAGLLAPRCTCRWPTCDDWTSPYVSETHARGLVLTAALFGDDPAGLSGDVTAALGGDAAVT